MSIKKSNAMTKRLSAFSFVMKNNHFSLRCMMQWTICIPKHYIKGLFHVRQSELCLTKRLSAFFSCDLKKEQFINFFLPLYIKLRNAIKKRLSAFYSLSNFHFYETNPFSFVYQRITFCSSICNKIADAFATDS